MSVAQTKALAREYLLAGRPPMIWGPPGSGKSEGVVQMAAEDDMALYETRMSLYESVDLHGLPHVVDSNVVWAVPDMIAALRAFPPKRRVLWFLDEINVATPAVMAACMQLVLNRRIGPHVLPDTVAMIAAGNKLEHRSSANRMPLAFGSRFGHIDHQPDPKEVRELGIKRGWNSKVVAFLGFRPHLVNQMPKDDNPAFPNSRSWEVLQRRIDHVSDNLRMIWARGLVGEGAAAEFESFYAVGCRAPKLEDILKNPGTHPLPGDDEPAMACAVAAMLALGATAANIDGIATYAERLPADLNVMVMFDATTRDKGLLKTPGFQGWAARNQDTVKAK